MIINALKMAHPAHYHPSTTLHALCKNCTRTLFRNIFSNERNGGSAEFWPPCVAWHFGPRVRIMKLICTLFTQRDQDRGGEGPAATNSDVGSVETPEIETHPGQPVSGTEEGQGEICIKMDLIGFQPPAWTVRVKWAILGPRYKAR